MFGSLLIAFCEILLNKWSEFSGLQLNIKFIILPNENTSLLLSPSFNWIDCSGAQYRYCPLPRLFIVWCECNTSIFLPNPKSPIFNYLPTLKILFGLKSL